MGGSLGMAAAKRSCAGLTRGREEIAVHRVRGSGGARMQEGILSLMQMRGPRSASRCCAKPNSLHRGADQPTTGGVTASYAMLGDVQIAEPGALIALPAPA